MQKNLKFSRICLIYFISLFCFVLIRLISAIGAFDVLNEMLSDATFTSIVQIVLMFLLPLTLFILLYKREKIGKTSLKTTLSEIGFKKISVKTVIISILIGVCVYIFNIVIASFFDAIISLFGYSGISSGAKSTNSSVWFLIFSLFFTAVLPGVFEEIMHRGFLLKGLKDGKNIKWAILFSGLFFGFMHLNVNQFFYATIIGIFFAFITLITKKIWPAIIMHFMNNAINVYFSWASKSGTFGSNFYSIINNFLKNENFALVVICSICFMLALTLLTAFLIVLLYNENNKDKKIYLRIFTEKHIKNFILLNQNKISTESTSLNYNTYISADNCLIPTQENTLNMFDLKDEKIEKFDFKYHIFFFAILLLGALLTFFTFVWGVL